MSGLEIVACVGAVVSAFNSGRELIKALKKRRKKRAFLLGNATGGLDQSLTNGPPAIQTRYDTGFAQFGPRFAQGDNIARDSMTATIIHLQQQLIQVLQLVVLSDNNAVDFGRLQNVSDISRNDAVNAMTQLSQRLAAAVPLSTILGVSNPVSVPSTAYCPQAIKAQERHKRRDWGQRIGAVCGSCNWRIPVKLGDTAFLAEWDFFCSHLSDSSNYRRLRCFRTQENEHDLRPYCKGTASLTGEEFLAHLREEHGYSDFTLY